MTLAIGSQELTAMALIPGDKKIPLWLLYRLLYTGDKPSYYYFLLAIVLHDRRHTRADTSYVTKGECPSGGGTPGVWTKLH
jgi:hypothetical protein